MDYFKQFKTISRDGQFINIATIHQKIEQTPIPYLIDPDYTLEEIAAYLFNTLPPTQRTSTARLTITKNLLKCNLIALNVSIIDKLN